MILILNGKIYDLESAKKAAAAYENFADFSVSKRKDKIFVKMGNLNAEYKEVLKDEFLNYLLSLAIQAKLS